MFKTKLYAWTIWYLSMFYFQYLQLIWLQLLDVGEEFSLG